MVDLLTLGPLDLRFRGLDRPDRPLTASPKRVALLCYLALGPRSGRWREELQRVFWPGQEASRARGSLNQALYFLRGILGGDALDGEGSGPVRINPERVDCDAWRFDRALAAGRREDALALYRGAVLEGFPSTDWPSFEQWLDAQRAEYGQRASLAALRHGEALEERGSPMEAALWSLRAWRWTPWDEGVLRRLMALLERCGSPAMALREYRAFRARLADELEILPARETRALAGRLEEAGASPSGESGAVLLPVGG